MPRLLKICFQFINQHIPFDSQTVVSHIQLDSNLSDDISVEMIVLDPINKLFMLIKKLYIRDYNNDMVSNSFQSMWDLLSDYEKAHAKTQIKILQEKLKKPYETNESNLL